MAAPHALALADLTAPEALDMLVRLDLLPRSGAKRARAVRRWGKLAARLATYAGRLAPQSEPLGANVRRLRAAPAPPITPRARQLRLLAEALAVIVADAAEED